MALATANIQDNSAIKMIDNLPHSTILSPLTSHSTPGSNNFALSAQNNPHLVRYMKSDPAVPKMTSPIAGAIIGGTTTATVGGQQLRLVHLVVNASSARSIAKSIREGKPIEAVPEGIENTTLTPVKSATTMSFAPTLQSNALSSSSSPSSPAIAPSPSASSCSDAESASSLALSSSSLQSSSSLISPENPSTCTICGKQYTERTEFNAHIRAHLKEKLHNKRNREQTSQKLSRGKSSNPEPISIKTEDQITVPEQNLLQIKSPIVLPTTQGVRGIELQGSIIPPILHSASDHSILQQQLSIKTTQPAKLSVQLPQVGNNVNVSSSTIEPSQSNQNNDIDAKITPIPNNLLPSTPVPFSPSVLSSNISTANATARSNNVLHQSQPLINLTSLPTSASQLFCKPHNLSITPVATNKAEKPDLGSLLQHVHQTNGNKPVVISPKVMAELAACKPIPISVSSAESPSTTSLLLVKDPRHISTQPQPLVQLVPTIANGLNNANIVSNTSANGATLTPSLQSTDILSSINSSTGIKVPSHSIIGIQRYSNINQVLNPGSTIDPSTNVPVPHVFNNSTRISSEVLAQIAENQKQNLSQGDMIVKGILQNTTHVPPSILSQTLEKKVIYSNVPVASNNLQESMGIHTRFPLKKKEKEDISRKVTSSTKPLDPMAYEMELNRIDFKNDVSSILDQIEKDFEINSVANIGEGLAPSAGNVELSSLNLETPPDSDSEHYSHASKLSADLNGLLATEEIVRNSFSENTPVKTGSNIISNDSNTLTKKIRLNALEDLELIDTSKSEIDRLLGDSQSASNEEKSSKKLESKQLSLEIARQNFSTSSRIKIPGSGNSILKSNGYPIYDKSTYPGLKNALAAPNTMIGQQVPLTPNSRGLNASTSISKPMKRKLLKCQHCALSFTAIEDLNSHLNLQHKSLLVSTSLPSSASTNIPVTKKERTTANKNFICSLCDKGFVQKSHLTRHMKIHGIDKKNGIPPDTTILKKTATVVPEQFICRICSKNCKNKIGLVRHRAKHLACVQCSEVFNNKVSLQDHLLKVHTKNALISIEQAAPSPSPPPILDSPTDSMSSFMFNEQNEPLFTLNNANSSDKLDINTGKANTGPKDARLSIVVSPNEISGMKTPTSNYVLDPIFSTDNIMTESFSEVSNSDFLESCTNQGLSDEFYSTDLF